jgi:hypothetical protein
MTVCHANSDTSTVREWVRALGTSERRFRDVCSVLNLAPKASLDFARMLRLVVRDKVVTLDNELAAGDIRTIRRLMDQAGLQQGVAELDLATYLARQRFVASAECLHELAKALEQQRPKLLA